MQTSHTIAFAYYLLAKNPEVQKKLQAEVDQVMQHSEDLTPEHITQMKYLYRVLKESLRLYTFFSCHQSITSNCPSGKLCLLFNDKLVSTFGFGINTYN